MKWTNTTPNLYTNTHSSPLVTTLKLERNANLTINDIILRCDIHHADYETLSIQLLSAGFAERDDGIWGVLRGAPGTMSAREYKTFLRIVDQLESLTGIPELAGHLQKEKALAMHVNPACKPTLFKPPLPSLSDLLRDAVVQKSHQQSVLLIYPHFGQAKALQIQLAALKWGHKKITSREVADDVGKKEYCLALDTQRYLLLTAIEKEKGFGKDESQSSRIRLI